MKYKIKKGNHSCCHWPHFNLYKKNYMFRLVRFESSCAAQPEAANCQNDINKAFGFSYGNHNMNSVRLGWRATPYGIELYLYAYVNSDRIIKRIGAEQNLLIKYNEKIGCMLKVTNGCIVVTITFADPTYRSEQTESVAVRNFEQHWGYDLFPYFGGDCTAPITMYIHLDEA